MNIAVRYYSRGGNTEKVAEAIAKAAGVEAKDCTHSIDEATDVLFLGGAVYGFGLDDHIKAYIAQLDSDHVKSVALFGTSAIVKTGNREMAKLIDEKGIPVINKSFHCNGVFKVMHRGHPNAEDLKGAETFALDVLKELR